MRVVVSGASGLIGSALCTSLAASGHDVIKLVRRSASNGEIPEDAVYRPASLEDVFVKLTGEELE